VLYVPAAAHTGGVGATRWRTDVDIKSREDSDSVVRIELLRWGRENDDPQDIVVEIGRRECVRLNDILHDSFDVSGGGALRIVPSEGSVVVSSRTYVDAEDGTYGQWVPAVPEEQQFGFGQLASIIHLSRSALPDTGFRTNLGVVNLADIEIQMQVDLLTSDGDFLGRFNKTLMPHEPRQINDVFALVTSEDVAEGYAEVRTLTRGGRFLVYASVVDNRSADAFFILGQRDLRVETDVWISGNATVHGVDVNLRDLPASWLVAESIEIEGMKSDIHPQPEDVTLTELIVRPVRIDGGDHHSPEWSRPVLIHVPAESTATAAPFAVYPTGFLDYLPLAWLKPENGGVDPETGRREIRQTFDLSMVGHTESGRSVRVSNLVAQFRFYWED
jgi:hypothetical protein